MLTSKLDGRLYLLRVTVVITFVTYGPGKVTTGNERQTGVDPGNYGGITVMRFDGRPIATLAATNGMLIHPGMGNHGNRIPIAAGFTLNALLPG
jgi:hypothetical protein